MSIARSSPGSSAHFAESTKSPSMSRGASPNRAFTVYATRGNDTIALLNATSNAMGVIPEALAFVAFFANNYDKLILRPI
jgi:hypothetical protein